MEEWDRYRAEFPITRDRVFMNHAAVSSPPLRVVETVESLLKEFSQSGVECYRGWMEGVARVRKLAAELINCRDHEVAFVPNTSTGLSLVAEGLQWKEGDTVLVPAPEFPANIYPWINLERRGVVVQFIQRKGGRFGVREIERALKPRARIVSVSSVDFSTGFLCDLEAMGDFCRQKGILFCVDGIQSLGIVPMDVRKYGIHFLAAGGHKWLLGLMGCGLLYLSEQANDALHPVQVGWKSVNDEENFFQEGFDLKPDALRFEPGTMNVAGIHALGASLELLLEAGVEEIYSRVIGINDLLIDGLEDRGLSIATPLSMEERSGILSFIPSSDPESLFRFLTGERIVVSLRGGAIRLSPHFYNNPEDVRGFFDALDRFGKRA